MDHTRHTEIYDASHLHLTLIGAGGIGALTAIALAKMGIKSLHIIDSDVVDQVNIPVQFHKHSDVGKSKAFSAMENVLAFTDMDRDYTVVTFGYAEADTHLSGDIVISAVDSINARKQIWEAVKMSNIKFYLDARMAAEEFHLYFIDTEDPVNVLRYDQIISNTNEVDITEIACTAKATIYCAAHAAGFITGAVKKISTDEKQSTYLVFNMKTNFLFTT